MKKNIPKFEAKSTNSETMQKFNSIWQYNTAKKFKTNISFLNNFVYGHLAFRPTVCLPNGMVSKPNTTLLLKN